MPDVEKRDASGGSAIAWTGQDSDPDVPMGPELVELFAACTARVQAGETVDVEQLAAEHPAHADEIRKLLPTLRGLACAPAGCR